MSSGVGASVPVGVLAESVGTLAQSGRGLVPRGSRVEVFQRIFEVFLVLGTLVGVVVVLSLA